MVEKTLESVAVGGAADKALVFLDSVGNFKVCCVSDTLLKCLPAFLADDVPGTTSEVADGLRFKLSPVHPGTNSHVAVRLPEANAKKTSLMRTITLTVTCIYTVVATDTTIASDSELT